MQFRSLVNLKVQRVDLIDDTKFKSCFFCRSEFPAQVFAHFSAEGAVHIVVEARVIDAKARHRHARNTAEAIFDKAVEHRSVSRRELLEHDERCSERARMHWN